MNRKKEKISPKCLLSYAKEGHSFLGFFTIFECFGRFSWLKIALINTKAYTVQTLQYFP